MFIDSINSQNNDCSLSAFGNVLICSNGISETKTVNFPNGYELDTNLSFKVLFVNGHNCADSSTHMTLTPNLEDVSAIPIVVNKNGTLIPLPIHQMTEGGTTVYKSLQPNIVLEMYYNSNYDGEGNGAFIVIGNPIVLSSDDYTIYADGYIEQTTYLYEHNVNGCIPYNSSLTLILHGNFIDKTPTYNNQSWLNIIDIYQESDYPSPQDSLLDTPKIQVIGVRSTYSPSRTDYNMNSIMPRIYGYATRAGVSYKMMYCSLDSSTSTPFVELDITNIIGNIYDRPKIVSDKKILYRN